MRIVATVELEKCVTRIGVFEVVVGKLRYWEEPCLVILLPIHKSPKVSFHSADLLLRLTVCLKVERSG